MGISFRSLIRKLMMLDPGYRKASFLEEKFEVKSAELLAAIKSLDATISDYGGILAAVKAADKSGDILAAVKAADKSGDILAAVKAADKSGDILAAVKAADKSGDILAAVRAADKSAEVLAAVGGATSRICGVDNLLTSYIDYVNPEIGLVEPVVRNAVGRRILVVGFYGGNNLGDELMLRAILKCARLFRDLRFTVMLAENKDYDSARLGDVDIIHYCRTTSDLSHLAARFDALLVGGGALLDDEAYQSSLNHFKSLSYIVTELPRYFKARGKKVACCGLSTNKRLVDETFRARIAEAVACADYFSVRDARSLAVLEECAGGNGSIRLVEDIVLSDSDIAVAPEARRVDCGTIVFGITWVAMDGFRQPLEDLVRRILALEERYRRHVRICLIPCYDFTHADIRFYESAVASLPPELAANVEIAAYNNRLAKTVALFDGCDAMVNMRYHAAVVCGARGIPQVVLEMSQHRHYPNKMKWAGERFAERACVMDAASGGAEICATLCAQYEKGRGATIGRDEVEENRRELARALAIIAGAEQSGKDECREV